MADLSAARVQPGDGVAPVEGLAANADGILRRGETGAEVTQLRGDLRTLGNRGGRNRDLADADAFDARVEQAVRSFQEQEGLPVNGRAGSELLAALHAAFELRRQRPRHADR